MNNRNRNRNKEPNVVYADRWATVEAIKVGDRIKFKACTRSDYRAVWRIVKGLDPLVVRYHGWGEFQVRDDEVLEVAKKEEA